MSTSFKAPPSWPDNKDFETYKSEVDVWVRITDVVAKKQALNLVYALTGRKRDTALSLGNENLEHENGMNRRCSRNTHDRF